MKEQLRKNGPRWAVFLLVAVVLTWTLLRKGVSRFPATPVVESVYREIEAIPDGSPILISSDFDPGSEAELEPMMKAVLAQCWGKRLRVTVMTLYSPNSVGLAERITTEAADEAGAVYGRDYALMGFRPGGLSPILALGQSWSAVYPVDTKDTKIADIPAMKGITKLGDYPMCVVFASSTTPDNWIAGGNAKYGLKLAIGCTAVMATDYYPHLSSGQIVGMMGGLAGAAQYESLARTKRLDAAAKDEEARQGLASANMPTQSVIHITIVLLIVVGNVLQFALKRRGGAA